MPASRRPLVALAANDGGPRREKRDYDPYGLEGTDDYDVDRPLAYREKIGPFLFTMVYRHEYPQVDDERLGTAFAVFHEASSDIVAAAVELKLVKVPPLTSSADLVYTLYTYSGDMLSLALAATEALGPEKLCEVFNAHRVIYRHVGSAQALARRRSGRRAAASGAGTSARRCRWPAQRAVRRARAVSDGDEVVWPAKLNLPEWTRRRSLVQT
ncbi:hypothetical protein [Candidatus Burkholderia verschuerenii]|uniref:hypothetical protein n=1 Tax=Candidatus Burkholderia verschuerenii TaxID=242163 RepID=UPI000B039380|nr:hypothetical protein [Candidatus Burkholderia verschuerenii]